jgi:iron complex transport system substrate-binding protein
MARPNRNHGGGHDAEEKHTAMKRRQQGILTGMPFMANISSRTFIDDLARKVYLAHPPHRIISLAPGVTESLFALGAGDRVIAVTEWCDYPPEAVRKAHVPGTSPDLQALMALEADLLLAPRASVDPALIEKLEQLKITIYVIEPKTVEDVLSYVHTIGRMLELPQAATRLVADMRRRIQQVKERTATLPRPRLLYVLKTQPLMTVGPGSLIHQLIEFAGAENIGVVTGQPSSEISIEQVRGCNPDVLVFPVGGSGEISPAELHHWQRQERLTAIRTGRVYRIDGALMARAGPRIVEGLERLAACLHPAAFPDIPAAGSPAN